MRPDERIRELESLLRRALDLTNHEGGDPTCDGCCLVADIRKALGVVPEFVVDEEDHSDLREALRDHPEKIRFSEQAKEALQRNGMTEDEILARLMGALGMKPQ